MVGIKRRFALFLKRWPVLYRFTANVYYTLSPIHLLELLVGTRARERMWARRHLHKGNDWNDTRRIGEEDEWVMGYWDSRSHSHRSVLLEKLSSYSPTSVLEIGCNCGPNLYLIAKRFPDIKITGIDISPKAIKKGKQLFTLEGISNVNLSVAKADELEQFQDGSFDITFTDAVMIYIGRDKIRKVVQEMLRVTRRVLILAERNYFKSMNRDPYGLGVYRYGCWERDYTALFKQFVPEEQIRLTKITEDMWANNPGWQETGAIIEIALQGQSGHALGKP